MKPKDENILEKVIIKINSLLYKNSEEILIRSINSLGPTYKDNISFYIV